MLTQLIIGKTTKIRWKSIGKTTKIGWKSIGKTTKIGWKSIGKTIETRQNDLITMPIYMIMFV